MLKGKLATRIINDKKAFQSKAKHLLAMYGFLSEQGRGLGGSDDPHVGSGVGTEGVPNDVSTIR